METIVYVRPERYGWTSSYRTYEEWKHWIQYCAIYKRTKFLPYLWGMETPLQYQPYYSTSSVLTVPMRNGNSFQSFRRLLPRIVLTVPMRNGNSTYHRWCEGSKSVLTVPMRNGNSDEAFQYAIENIGSYRTYEEWKHWYRGPNNSVDSAFLPYLWGMETKQRRRGKHEESWFLPYLWGMETRMKPSNMQ